VLGALGVQLVVCASGTDAAALPVRIAIAALAAVALAASVASFAVGRRRRDVDGAVEPVVPVVALVTALASVVLVLVAVLVPSGAIC
jgi:hypothetical protein